MSESLNSQDILKKYGTAMQEYVGKIFPGFLNYLDTQRQPFEPFLKKLFNFYLFSSYLADSGLFPREEKLTPLRILYAKAALTLFGIYSCLRNGLVTEGVTLLRSLFEVYVNVTLILQKDTDERLRLYDDFQLVEQWNNLQAKKSLLAAGKISQETFDETFSSELVEKVEQNYLSVKANYHPKQPYHWAWKIFRDQNGGKNPSLRFIANELGLQDDYVGVYGSLSISVHSSPSLINILSTDQSISLAPRFSPLIYNVGCLGVHYAAHIIESVARYLKFGEPDEIAIYISAYVVSVDDEYRRDG